MQNLTQKKALITISKDAITRIKFLLSQKDKKAYGIRVSVKKGGCSGLAYNIEYAYDKNPAEEEILQDDVRVLVDPLAVMYLVGSEMDFTEDKFKSGFTFLNPNEKGKCGCGSSFSA
ncbi:MAG: iron-sulfur cluster assembly accessory protein [Rickettsiaceae bacterium]|nr:iron-sulfur cluster assembly accessory protein [Rickettsiaceae bacterium]